MDVAMGKKKNWFMIWLSDLIWYGLFLSFIATLIVGTKPKAQGCQPISCELIDLYGGARDKDKNAKMFYVRIWYIYTCITSYDPHL